MGLLLKKKTQPWVTSMLVIDKQKVKEIALHPQRMTIEFVLSQGTKRNPLRQRII